MRHKPKWFEDRVPDEVASSSLFKFNIKVGKFKQSITINMIADIDIDYDNIRQQLEDAPAEFAYWAAIYSELKMQTIILDRKIKARRGKLVDSAVKGAFKASTRLTDKQVAAIVEADKELGRMEAESALINKHCGKMYFMVEAIRMKSDNLRSLAGFARAELQDSNS